MAPLGRDSGGDLFLEDVGGESSSVVLGQEETVPFLTFLRAIFKHPGTFEVNGIDGSQVIIRQTPPLHFIDIDVLETSLRPTPLPFPAVGTRKGVALRDLDILLQCP